MSVESRGKMVAATCRGVVSWSWNIVAETFLLSEVSTFLKLSCLLSDQPKPTNLRPFQSNIPNHLSFPHTHITTKNNNNVFSYIDLLERRWASPPPHPVGLKLLKTVQRSVSTPAVQRFQNDANLYPYSCFYSKTGSVTQRVTPINLQEVVMVRGSNKFCVFPSELLFFWVLTRMNWDNKTNYFHTETLQNCDCRSHGNNDQGHVT